MKQYKVTTVLLVPFGGRKWVVTREFNGLAHYENWTKHMTSIGYVYDESFVNYDSGQPFGMDEPYWRIIDGKVCCRYWSESDARKFFNEPDGQKYFLTRGDALEHLTIFGA